MVEGAEVELGGPQQRLVLAMLAEAAGRVVTTDQLVDRIWGDAVPDHARKTIQVHVSKLRKALAAPGVIETSGGGYRLRADVTVDAAEFERLVAEARRIAAHHPRRAATLLQEALGLWRGPAFADIRDEGGVYAESMRLEELRLGVMEDRIDAEIAAGRAADAVAELESLIERHPGRERLRALHMLALYRSGRQPAALAAYQNYRAMLAEEHGLDPSPELAALELQILNQDPALGATEAVGARRPGPALRLPGELTSFVGRTEELAAVTGLLREHRLVTLTGPGGAGKTRMALRLGAEPSGVGVVWLVELAALTDADLVDDEVAEAVGADAPPGTTVPDAIAAAIGDREALLILDNCEQVRVAAADLAHRLLRACPGLRILATSREALGIQGEAGYRLPPLAVPAAADVATALDYDAVQLFVERAAATRPFAVTDDNVGEVVAICRHLDGLPLAIELAAARVATLAPGQIAARLDERFRILVGAHLDVPDRHQTMQAAIDWSYDLLTGDEQVLWCRLSVFAGTFSLEAAEGVCAARPLETGAVLDLLESLIRKSMVRPEDGTGGETRYRILQSMRDYGAAKLADVAGAWALPARHVAHYIGVAEALQEKYRAGEHAEALAALREDEDNLRAALRFSLDHLNFEEAARIIGAIGFLWYLAGAYREGIDWCAELFAANVPLPDPLQAQALHSYGTLLAWDRLDAAAEVLEREVVLRRRLGDPARLASALNNLGDLLNDLGRIEQGKAHLAEAISQFRAAGEAPTYALVALGYGGHQAVGDHERAGELFAEALAAATADGDAYGVALATTYLGQSALHTGRLVEARALLQDARDRFAELGTAPGVLDADFNLALIDRREGSAAAAAARLLQPLEAPDQLWYPGARFWILQVAASLIEDLPLAARLLGAATAYYETAQEVQPVQARDGLEATSRRLREAMGSEAFHAAFAAGRRMSAADAIAAAQAALRRIAYP